MATGENLYRPESKYSIGTVFDFVKPACKKNPDHFVNFGAKTFFQRSNLFIRCKRDR